jgi:hypothetical protein
MLQAVGSHQNIIKLEDFYYSNPNPHVDRHLDLVSELMPGNLSDYIKGLKAEGQLFPVE